MQESARLDAIQAKAQRETAEAVQKLASKQTGPEAVAAPAHVMMQELAQARPTLPAAGRRKLHKAARDLGLAPTALAQA